MDIVTACQGGGYESLDLAEGTKVLRNGSKERLMAKSKTKLLLQGGKNSA